MEHGGLQIRGVSKRFGKLAVLRDVSLDVAEGEFITLLGPSGCGKTTLLRIIAGLELADAGEVVLAGQRLNDVPAHRRPVNTVFQSYALFPHMRVHANISFGLRCRGLSDAECKARVDKAMAMLKLDGLDRRYPHQLSGGQRQRVALARALVNEPQVLLLDEPMSALDAKLRAEVQVELRRLQRRLGRAFILVTHDQDEAMTVSDRILVMHQGRIAQSGAPADVYERPNSRFVAEFLGSANLIAASKSVDVPNGCVQTHVGELHLDHQPAWDERTLMIRPERIRLRREPPPLNAVEVVIREMVYRGDHVEAWLEPGPLRVRTMEPGTVAVGDRLWAELPPEHLEVLEADDVAS